MARRSNRSAGRFGDSGKKQMEFKSWEDADREYFESFVGEVNEDGTKTMPVPKIVKYHDLVGKLWGWDNLLPFGDCVSWFDYIDYLKAYYIENADKANKGLSIAALAKNCLVKEEQLASEWKMWMKSKMEMILPMSKQIVLSCLIHQCASSVINTAGYKLSAVSNAALWCIAKEADLTLELLRRGADPIDDYLIVQGSKVRMCALSLMNCTLHNSVAASAAMLGIAKEAEMMHEWMGKNDMLLDVFDDPMPDVIADSRAVRFRTLGVMVDILEKSSGAGGGHKIDGAANTKGGSSSYVFNCPYQKIEDGKKSKKRKRKEEDLLGKLWGWERLLPLYHSAELGDYSNYLGEYYNRNALKFVADAAADQNPEDILLDPVARAVQIATTDGSSLAAVAKCCLKMEEELVSKWKTRVRRSLDDHLPFSTIIQSSLIKERALAICNTGGEFSVASAVAFVCITKEADLMCELLKHGAEPIDDIVQLSSVIRMCALGLVNLKGYQSIASAAAMVGMGKEAKEMSDWMKRENKLLTLSLSEPHEPSHLHFEEGRLIRIRTLDVMTSILLESSFPSKMQDDAMAFD